jgi:hypothetical protein
MLIWIQFIYTKGKEGRRSVLIILNNYSPKARWLSVNMIIWRWIIWYYASKKRMGHTFLGSYFCEYSGTPPPPPPPPPPLPKLIAGSLSNKHLYKFEILFLQSEWKFLDNLHKRTHVNYMNSHRLQFNPSTHLLQNAEPPRRTVETTTRIFVKTYVENYQGSWKYHWGMSKLWTSFNSDIYTNDI